MNLNEQKRLEGVIKRKRHKPISTHFNDKLVHLWMSELMEGVKRWEKTKKPMFEGGKDDEL